MQFEKFDNKVRQAADQHHPNYDEKAWAKMEKLLDHELPQQKNDRRKFLFLLLFLLLLGGGAWLIIGKPWQSSTNEETASKNLSAEPVIKPNIDQTKTATGDQTSRKTTTEKSTTEPVNATTEPVSPVVNTTVKSVTPGKNDQTQTITDKKLSATTNSTTNKRVKKNSNPQDQLIITSLDAAKTKKPVNNLSDNPTTPIMTSPLKKDDVVKKDPDKNDLAATAKNNSRISPPANINTDTKEEAKKNVSTEQSKQEEQKNIAQAGKKKKKNELFFSLSAGPDVSYVGLDNPGKIKLLGGMGIGYTIGDRLTVRTGFYTAHKVYTASKYEYKPSVQIQGYPYLDRVDANCNVYEIPLNLAYNFGESEKQNFFASAGLSSFIMKKEVYDYQFIYPNNPVTYSYTKTINNENKHYFSVLGLSMGYQRRISKVLSLSAEPYVKLPLGGIGYGKVKLNSAGILFSANFRPFH